MSKYLHISNILCRFANKIKDMVIDSKDNIISFCNIYKGMNHFVNMVFNDRQKVNVYKIKDVSFFSLNCSMCISVSYKTKSGWHTIDLLMTPSELLGHKSHLEIQADIYRNQLI